MKDALGDRIKSYEDQETYARFLPYVPIIARIDGRCFSNFTKGMKRPFDVGFSNVMQEVTARLVKETNACIGYTQSDEINLCWYKPKMNSEIFFGGRKFKMIGQLAAMATAHLHIEGMDEWGQGYLADKTPTFDARVFQVPTLSEGANAILWRQLDCRKNAISMVARSIYSHKELYGKTGRDMLEMIEKAGIDYDEILWQHREGVFIRKETVRRRLTQQELADIPEDHRSNLDEEVMRTQYVEVQIPLLSELENATDVIFFGAEPLQKTRA